MAQGQMWKIYIFLKVYNYFVAPLFSVFQIFTCYISPGSEDLAPPATFSFYSFSPLFLLQFCIHPQLLSSSYVYQSQDIALSIFPVFFQPYMSSLTPSLSLTLRTSKARVSAKSQLDTNVVDLGRLLTTPKKEN